jgi:hypothetical protein
MTIPLDRSEALRPPPNDRDWKQTLWVILGILMFGAMLVAAAIYTAPALVSDWQVRNTARPISNAEVTQGKCSSKIIFHICDVTLTVETPSGDLTRRMNYVFTGAHVGDYNVQVMADPARPELATTDLGLDKLWNRTITLLIVAGVLLAFTILPVVAAVRSRRASRAAR